MLMNRTAEYEKKRLLTMRNRDGRDVRIEIE